MKISDLTESSPENLVGSFSDDLVHSKAWLCNKLKQIQNKFNSPFSTITVLGSWYGNIGLFLDKENIEFDNLILLDIDENALKIGANVLGNLDRYKILPLVRDANQHHYQDLPDQCVINTSTNDMPNNGWYDKIPGGTMVALQARNKLQSVPVLTETLEDFDMLFPMQKVFIRDKHYLSDPEIDYFRFMKIGIK